MSSIHPSFGRKDKLDISNGERRGYVPLHERTKGGGGPATRGADQFQNQCQE